jgi:hypothetical protein
MVARSDPRRLCPAQYPLPRVGRSQSESALTRGLFFFFYRTLSGRTDPIVLRASENESKHTRSRNQSSRPFPPKLLHSGTSSWYAPRSLRPLSDSGSSISQQDSLMLSWAHRTGPGTRSLVRVRRFPRESRPGLDPRTDAKGRLGPHLPQTYRQGVS